MQINAMYDIKIISLRDPVISLIKYPDIIKIEG